MELFIKVIDNVIWTTWICIFATIIFIYFRKFLKGWENGILVILLLNVGADLLSNISLLNDWDLTGAIYNVMPPIERVVTLIIYAKNSNTKLHKSIYYTGSLIVVFISILGLVHFNGIDEFQRETYVGAGVVIAVLSYMHLKSMALDKAGDSAVMVTFSVANLVYFTLMVSSQSSVELANSLSEYLAKIIDLVHDMAYAAWSIILIAGIGWKYYKT